jgi:hypothetical protein
LADEIPQFTFQGKWSATGFASAADGVTVVADSVLEEEVAIGIGGREALGRAAVGY